TTAKNTAVSVHDAGTESSRMHSLTYCVTGLPSGLTIDAGTGLITGTVNYDALRTYTTVVTVTDNGTPAALSTAVTFTWNTTNVNRAPVVTNPGTQTTAENTAVSLQVVATDPDTSDTLTYSVTGLPSGLTI